MYASMHPIRAAILAQVSHWETWRNEHRECQSDCLKIPFSISHPILVLFYYLYIVLYIGYALDQLRLIGYLWYNMPEIPFEDSGTVPHGQ